MRLLIDTHTQTLAQEDDAGLRTLDLYSDEAFALISREWLKVGWNQKHVYTFSWLGRPIIQLPEDMIRVQEVIYAVQPDVIIETGVAHGGSLVYYASLLKILGKGRVVGIDIDIRTPNRHAIENHELSSLITLIEGSSVAPDIVEAAGALIKPGESVLVILDSCHTRAHVRAELEAYHRFVTKGSYIVVTDGSMRDLSEVPRGHSEWREDNPATAAEDFAATHPEFTLKTPAWPFNESTLPGGVTHWPSAWLRRER